MKTSTTKTIHKVYISKPTTDKVGDILVNQAGVKYCISGAKLVPTGKNKVLSRALEITPLSNSVNKGKPFVMNENSVKYARDKKILSRESISVGKKKYGK